MMQGLTRRLFLATLGAVLLALPARAEDLRVQCPAPDPMAKCPVCGMFVAKYPDWVTTVLYKDGHAHHFDGAKDMFKYLLDLAKYAPDHGPGDIRTIAVTEYYSVETIDARRAFYVVGSDVYGPMGHELVPLASQADAEAFMADHRGERIVRFDDVDRALLALLDERGQ